ncbi:ATP-binding protein [Peribacillus sp. SCS-26]|uniref:ATP-binding protein n=1 Tax=Paraperibacillus marinus TaxID=3115295 RepID=UPI003905A855
MDKALESLGKKIIHTSSVLAESVVQNHKADMVYRILGMNLEDSSCMLQQFFKCIGESLAEGDQEAGNNLAALADIFGQRAIQAEISLDLTYNFIFTLRSVILEFINEAYPEIDSRKELLSIIKHLDIMFNMLFNVIAKLYIDSYSITKFALDESAGTLSITLKELADLKNALNEATIFAITGKKDEILYVNEHFCEITKYTRNELIGQNHSILNSGHHPVSFFREIWEAIQEGRIWKGEILNKAKDGTLYWVDTTIVPFMDEQGRAYQHISIQYDITEKKKTEEVLGKAEKLSLVGELAAGIAHEIRNPLTTIKGFVQLLKNTPDESKLLYADTILEEIDRINYIVSEFMVFAKPHAVYFSSCNICEILQSVISLLEAEAALKGVIITYQGSGDAVIYGERNQLKQVFLNLIKNAIEAMPHGGEVRLAAGNAGSAVTVTIEDTGIGMSQEQIKRLGEPFNTTKPAGNGLGLMVSYKIIHNHHGTILVESESEKGTRFHISFPMNHPG